VTYFLRRLISGAAQIIEAREKLPGCYCKLNVAEKKSRTYDMAGIKRKADTKSEKFTTIKKAKSSADSAKSSKPTKKPAKSKPEPVQRAESDLDESDTTEDENDGFGFSANVEAEEDGFESEEEVDVKPKKLAKTNGAVQTSNRITSNSVQENLQEVGEKANVLQDKLGGIICLDPFISPC